MTRVLIEDFPHGPGGHCSSTALRDILKFYGHDFTEDMVFGLGVGLAFVYYHHRGMKPPVYIGGRVYNLEEHVCEHLGVEMDVQSGLDEKRAFNEVRELLDAGIPTMVHADVFYLDYLRAKRHFSGHRVVLVGYDDEKGVAFVADNDREEIQECGLDNLAKARSASYLPQPADNAYYRFEVPASLVPLEEAIPPALEKAVRYNLRLPQDRARVNFQGADVTRGIQGLNQFVDSMPTWPDSMDSSTLTLLCKTVYVNAEKGGTGYGGNFRRIYGRFLKESSAVLDVPELDRAGDEFIAIGDIWTRLALTFKELSAEGDRAVSEAEPLAGEIASREKEAFLLLEKISGSMGDPK